MKKYILLFTTLALAAGCYEDKGNYDYAEIGDFYVDDTDIQTNFTRPIFSVLELEPDIVYDGDREGLDFLWRAYNADGMSHAVTVLSEEENLSVPITMMPGHYTLEFRATERATERIATFLYDLTVESSGAGMLVLYERGGKTDFGLITPTYMFGNAVEDGVSYDLFSMINPDYPLDGAPVAIDMYNDAYVQHITLLTDEAGVRLSPADMTVTAPFPQWFSFAPGTVVPRAYRAVNGVLSGDFDEAGLETSDGMELMINDGALCANPTILMAFGSRPVFVPYSMGAGYTAAPFVFQGNGSVVTYDTRAGGFVSGGTMFASTLTKVSGDLSAIGKDMIYMDYGYGTAGGTGNYSTNAIFRDPGSARHYFYAMNLYDFSLTFSADISSYTGIAQATAFACARRGPLAYYASGGTIYQIKYNYEAKTVESNALTAWNGLGNGESITVLKMCPHPGRNLPGGASVRDKYLFVGAYNESTQEGKVYVLGVNLETDGSLVAEPVAVYGGFGRIKDFGFKF